MPPEQSSTRGGRGGAQRGRRGGAHGAVKEERGSQITALGDLPFRPSSLGPLPAEVIRDAVDGGGGRVTGDRECGRRGGGRGDGGRHRGPHGEAGIERLHAGGREQCGMMGAVRRTGEPAHRIQRRAMETGRFSPKNFLSFLCALICVRGLGSFMRKQFLFSTYSLYNNFF